MRGGKRERISDKDPTFTRSWMRKASEGINTTATSPTHRRGGGGEEEAGGPGTWAPSRSISSADRGCCCCCGSWKCYLLLVLRVLKYFSRLSQCMPQSSSSKYTHFYIFQSPKSVLTICPLYIYIYTHTQTYMQSLAKPGGILLVRRYFSRLSQC